MVMRARAVARRTIMMAAGRAERRAIVVVVVADADCIVSCCDFD